MMFLSLKLQKSYQSLTREFQSLEMCCPLFSIWVDTLSRRAVNLSITVANLSRRAPHLSRRIASLSKLGNLVLLIWSWQSLQSVLCSQSLKKKCQSLKNMSTRSCYCPSSPMFPAEKQLPIAKDQLQTYSSCQACHEMMAISGLSSLPTSSVNLRRGKSAVEFAQNFPARQLVGTAVGEVGGGGGGGAR